jgi:fumarylacetoacetate (FAA) hydrolase family protein
VNDDLTQLLPRDHDGATLLGRIWRPGAVSGPSIVVVDNGEVFDITAAHPLMAEILNSENPSALVQGIRDREHVGSALEVLANTHAPRSKTSGPRFLAPTDLQSVKACGVTFIDSLMERVIEEHCGGKAAGADEVRREIEAQIGNELRTVRPGTAEADALKSVLQARGLWSQYLEVGLGRQVEIFTKCQPLSAVGVGAEIGVHRESMWSNPEPEVVLAISAAGKIVGCTLGNDVNLRDFEGRSALLLGVAKDNNASCAIGPFIRLLDENFDVDDVRNLSVTLSVEGADGFSVRGVSNMAAISRDVEDMASQVIGAHHQYPDGLVLFTGTMFVPTVDREEAGAGFTHKLGDVVRIHSPRLGTLTNYVGYSDRIEPWSFGATHLMRNLAARGYLRSPGQ